MNIQLSSGARGLVFFYHSPDLGPYIVCAGREGSGETRQAHPGPQIRVRNRKLFSLFLNQNICCGYSKEPSHGDSSFEHPKHMFKLKGKEIITILI